jgi:hypothetical protein
MWRRFAWLVSRPAVASWLIARAQRTPYTHLDGYMHRWWLFNPFAARSGSGTRYPWCPISIRVHHILRRDHDRALHDHPWNARTIILRGWYHELREDDRFHIREAGDTAALRFGEFHRILEVSPGGVYTLFITGRYRGTWGFKVDGAKVPHREYLGE